VTTSSFIQSGYAAPNSAFFFATNMTTVVARGEHQGEVRLGAAAKQENV
jgi:hypothetical protein